MLQWEELRSEAAFSLVAGKAVGGAEVRGCLLIGRSRMKGGGAEALSVLLIGAEPLLMRKEASLQNFLSFCLGRISSVLFFHVFSRKC